MQNAVQLSSLFLQIEPGGSLGVSLKHWYPYKSQNGGRGWAAKLYEFIQWTGNWDTYSCD